MKIPNNEAGDLIARDVLRALDEQPIELAAKLRRALFEGRYAMDRVPGYASWRLRFPDEGIVLETGLLEGGRR